ncbi:MAG: hypothetical protein AAFN94_15160 [Pseudomonadota bacterium]
MTTSIDIDSLDRLISNAGLGSFELVHSRPAPAPRAPVAKPHLRRVSQDFLLDLNLAGRRVIQAITDLVHSDKGRAALMTALDGQAADTRTPEATQALTDLLLRFVGGDTTLQFLPAVNSPAPEMAGGVHSLPLGCTCALGADLDTVFASADLGFRDLFQVTQTAAIKALILQAEPLGLLQDPVTAFIEIATLLGSDTADPSQDATLDTITLGAPDGPRTGYGTSFVQDT